MTGAVDTLPDVRTPVDFHQFSSSNIHSALYDYGSLDLYIRFHGTRLYAYSFVEEDVWDAWTQAASAGSYHHENIKWDYPYEELSRTDFPQQGRAYDTPQARQLILG